MSAFADALGVLFLDANLSVEIWHRDSEGQFTRARGILRRPDEITEFGAARLLSDTTRIDVRVADIPDPRPQEQILIGEETGEPVMETVVVHAPIEPLLTDVEQPVYDNESGELTGTEMVQNPAVVQDDAERADAHAVIDGTPTAVRAFAEDAEEVSA